MGRFEGIDGRDGRDGWIVNPSDIGDIGLRVPFYSFKYFIVQSPITDHLQYMYRMSISICLQQ